MIPVLDPSTGKVPFMNTAQYQPETASTALDLAGSIKSAPELAQHLAWLSDQGHLVSPAMASAHLPEGCEVTTSAVLIDAHRETYKVGATKEGGEFVDLRALGKVALERIAAAAGVSWDPSASGRLDDGSNPHYCMWRAVGTIRHFDGSDIMFEGSKEMDMRKGSAQIEALWDRYCAALNTWEHDGKKGRKPKDPEAQIREMRLHIVAHAESKARLRAIRSGLGLRSYTFTDLQLPFIVARLAFTGQSSDPETKRMFAGAIANAFLGGRRALFGGDAAPPRAATRPALAPPPVGASHLEDDDEDDLPDSWNQAPVTQAKPAQEAHPQVSQPKPSKARSEERKPSGVTVPGGEEKGQPIEKASTDALDYWSKRIAKDMDAGKSRDRAYDQRRVDAMNAELSSRRAS